MQLSCHPSTPAHRAIQIDCRWDLSSNDTIQLHFRLSGDIGALRIPPHNPALRSDHLWRTTCLEWIIADSHGAGYLEFNFAPSGGWQVYRFEGYRSGQHELPVAVLPQLAVETRHDAYILRVNIDRELINPGTDRSRRRMTFCAVIEDHAGYLSYWALAHSSARPDFHLADGFVAVGEF